MTTRKETGFQARLCSGNITLTRLWRTKRKNKALIVSRIISHGLTEDWYAGFDMYGIDGFGQIAKK